MLNFTKKFLFIIIIFCLIITITGLAFACVMTSPVYRIQTHTINVGGVRQASPHYHLEATIGEIAIEKMISSSFHLRTGFQARVSDIIKLTVIITSTALDPTNVSPIPMIATFSEPVIDFISTDITVANGAATNLTTTDNIIFNFNVTPTTDGLVSVDIAAGLATDIANNPNIAALQFGIVFDSVAPAITINPVITPTNVTTQTITGTREEGVTVTLASTTGTAFGTVTTPTATTWSVVATLVEGLNNITATATDAAGNTGTVTATIVLDTRPFDFSLVLSPSTATVSQGKEVNATVTTTLDVGITENISLAAELPAGVTGITITFAPLLGKPTFESLMIITATVDATLGVHLITITATGAGGLVRTADFTLTVIEPPILSVTPASLDFGEVVLGQFSDLSFTVTNIGEGTLTGEASLAAGPFSIVSGSPFSLGAGASAIVAVRFSPPMIASFSDTVTFTSNVGNLQKGVSGLGVIVQGDLNKDGEVSISDVILCLRMALEMPVTIEGVTHYPPYPQWLIERADMHVDGEVSIADVIFILRRAIGLD